MSNILIGQSLGRYHILEQLGEGGMATVYKAFDTRLERDVALKIIRRGAFPPDQLDRILKRFEREAKVLAKLSHPNIVGVIDYGEYEGSPYLVMEYLPGGTLKQQLGKPIPWKDAARLLLPVARALQFAHTQGILHRDVKPSNILITLSGEPMLSDFGIAKLLESEDTQTLTDTGMGVGTPEYMAPEQWTGKGTPQSDVYSLGVVFYELITGRKPYIADTPAAILLKQATETLPRPAKFVSGLPEAVEKVLLKALARNAQDRYIDMSAMGNALETLLIGRPLQAEQAVPISVAQSHQKPKAKVPISYSKVDSQLTIDQTAINTTISQRVEHKRRKLTTDYLKPRVAQSLHTWLPFQQNALWYVLGGILLIILVFLVGKLALSSTTSVKSSLADKASQFVQLRTQQGSNSVYSVAFNPDGNILASGSYDIRLWRVADGSLLRTLAGGDHITSVAFSPDGNILASGSGGNTIQLWRVSDGSALRTLEGHTDSASSVAFSPDGTILASGSFDKTIRLWRVADGSLLRTFEGHTGEVSSVAFSPDGSNLASGSFDKTIRLWRVADGSLLRTLDGGNYITSVAFSPDGNILASGSGGNTIQLWRVSDGRLAASLGENNAESGSTIFSLAFSPDGSILASGSGDKTIVLWRVSDRSQLRTLKGHQGSVSSVAFDPDGTTLVSGSTDATIRLWGLTP